MNHKGSTNKTNVLLIIASAVAFLVVLTILILLALKFDIFGVQNPQPQQTTAPASQTPAVDTQNDGTQTDENAEKPDDSQGQEGNQNTSKDDEKEGGLQVGVDDGNQEEENNPNEGDNTISFDDLLAAAGKNEQNQ